jgi:archaeal cell division control protein 6
MSIKKMLMWDETLFRDPDVFEIDYIPEQFNHRETQMRELAFQLRPGMKGGRPLNTILKGLPGTGKTTTVRKIFSDIEDSTTKMIPVYVNCQIDNTKFSVLSQVYKKITGHNPSAAGNSFKRVFESVAQIISQEEKVIIVALDDANYLVYENELNKLLYILLRSHETYPGTRIGVITIISDMDVDLKTAIDARVSSVFCPTDIYFPPYQEEEIRTILTERVMQGLYPGALSDALLDIVIAHTLASGDLRVGIDLLKRATLNAERQAERSISGENISEAYQVSKYLHLQYCLKALKKEETDILKLVAVLSDQEEQLTMGALYQAVNEKTKIGYTRFYEIIKKLDAIRVLNLAFKEGRGRTRLINLRYEPEKILMYLK